MKNKVIINERTVTKIYGNPVSYGNEVKILRLLDGRFAPKIIEVGENYIKMEKIEGEMLIEYLTVANGDAFRVGDLLGDFFIFFHGECRGITLSDVNFHNFIINADGLSALDFEETENGVIKDAVVKTIAFARRDLPVQTANIFSTALCGKTGIDLTQIESKIEEYKSFLVKRKSAKRHS